MSFVVRYSAGVIAIVTVCLTAGSAEAQESEGPSGQGSAGRRDLAR